MADLSTSIRSKKFGQNSLALVTDVVTNEEHDEYGKTGWGESDAVDEFFKKKSIKINSVRHSNQPTAYIVKK